VVARADEDGQLVRKQLGEERVRGQPNVPLEHDELREVRLRDRDQLGRRYRRAQPLGERAVLVEIRAGDEPCADAVGGDGRIPCAV
jgi:hypothetical protein